MSFPIDIESMLGPFGDPQTRRLAEEVIALRKQIALDRQSREASQAEFARLNRELNEAKDTARKISEAHGELFSLLVEERSRIGVLLDEIASAAIAAGMMDPARRGLLDGPNAIQFLRQMKEEFERNRA
jgi:hypothetical protein